MSDLYQLIQEDFLKNNFSNPPQIVADGKIHRFKRNSSDNNSDAWYVCFVNRHNGREFLAGAYGDWHDMTWIKFCTDISLPADEKEKYHKKAERAFEKEQIEKWEETAKACQEFWESYTETEGMHAYLARKKIAGLYGSRLSEGGKTLLVPVRDIDGKLWGFQKIYEDGKKLFQPGTKKKGCFHTLGTISVQDVLYLCEGFATACSIHLATEAPVVVGFDSGNLVEVARILRDAYPSLLLVVCGDDDFLTENNPGKTKAEEAAKVGLGILVLPVFKDRHTKPTDFNDLHALEGLEAVREQILANEPKSYYVNCLGFRGDTYFYTSSDNLQILEINGHSETDLLKLMPEAYWKSQYPSEAKKGAINWNSAKSDLMRRAREKGIFVKERVRGNGVWVHENRVICHLGDRLFVDQEFHHLHSLDSKYFYALDDSLPDVSEHPLSVEDLERFRVLLTQFNYVTAQQSLFLGGWMALAPVCGVLPWRPHLWLTGEPGSGKTTVKDFIDEYLMHAFKRLSVIGATSEAGIRQRLGAAAIPLVFDEFEPEGKKGISRVEDCLDLTRQASSEQRGEIVKGSGTGQAVSYSARFMALFSSVKPRLIAEADRSRFTYIELNKSAHTNDQWDALKTAMHIMTPSFARRLFARTLNLIPVILHNTKIFQRAFVSNGATQRIGQQYGTLLAGWHSLQSDDKISLEEAIGFVKSISLESEDSISKSKDQEECLDFLLNYFVPVNDTKVLFVKIIQNKNQTNYTECLENFKMKVLESGSLFIGANNPQLDLIFEKSKWGASWKQILTRLDGVDRRAVQRIHGICCKGFIVPKIFFEATPTYQIHAVG